MLLKRLRGAHASADALHLALTALILLRTASATSSAVLIFPAPLPAVVIALRVFTSLCVSCHHHMSTVAALVPSHKTLDRHLLARRNALWNATWRHRRTLLSSLLARPRGTQASHASRTRRRTRAYLRHRDAMVATALVHRLSSSATHLARSL